MRVLFLSNFYPPAGRGGYEQWCQEVAEGLEQRGHIVRVETSRHAREDISGAEPDWIRRNLFLEMDFRPLVNALDFFFKREARENFNLAYLKREIETFQPDAVLVFGMWNLSRSLLRPAEESLPGRVVYYLADYWPTLPNQYESYWLARGRRGTDLLKQLLRPAAKRILAREPRYTPRFAHALFCSAFMLRELERRGVRFGETRVIYGAVDTRPFLSPRQQNRSEPLSMLYVGRLEPIKGVETAITACRIIHRSRGAQSKLTIVGKGDPAYEHGLRDQVRREGLEELVEFAGPQPPSALIAFYRQSDVVVFPSTWPEPFGRVLVEAMAAEAAVVGTRTGGAAEILVPDENGLTFEPGDADGLAAQILRLRDDPALRRRLAENGRRAALEKFDLSRMIGEFENYLLRLAPEHEHPLSLSVVPVPSG